MVKVTDTTDSCQVKSPNSRIFFLMEKTLKLFTFFWTALHFSLSHWIYSSWLVKMMRKSSLEDEPDPRLLFLLIRTLFKGETLEEHLKKTVWKKFTGWFDFFDISETLSVFKLERILKPSTSSSSERNLKKDPDEKDIDQHLSNTVS